MMCLCLIYLSVSNSSPSPQYDSTTSTQEQSVKYTSIELCKNKSPTQHLIPWSPNNQEMKDLLKSTANKVESRRKIFSNDEPTVDNILGINMKLQVVFSILIHSYFIQETKHLSLVQAIWSHPHIMMLVYCHLFW